MKATDKKLQGKNKNFVYANVQDVFPRNISRSERVDLHLRITLESFKLHYFFFGILQFCVCVSRGGYSHTLPIRVCAAQRGRDFEGPDLERGIHFRGVF